MMTKEQTDAIRAKIPSGMHCDDDLINVLNEIDAMRPLAHTGALVEAMPAYGRVGRHGNKWFYLTIDDLRSGIKWGDTAAAALEAAGVKP